MKRFVLRMSVADSQEEIAKLTPTSTSCISHRHSDAHACTAPGPAERYAQAKSDRREAAKVAIQAVMPGRHSNDIPPAPAGKEVGGLNVAEKLGRPPNVQSVRRAPPEAISQTPRIAALPQGKDEKLRAIALMKLKSKAVAGSSTATTVDPSDRWYFSWSWDEAGTLLRSDAKLTASQAVWFAKVRQHR
jgi:hypothetical protein